MNTADCVIVGGGLIGMMTARELLRAGMRVTLMEKGETGRESTWAGGGILSPLYPWRYPDSVSQLARWGQRHYQAICNDLIEETGLDPEWTQSGLVSLDLQDESAAILLWAESQGISVTPVSDAQLQQQFPYLGVQAEQSFWFPEIAQVRNPRFAKALRASVLHYGGRILEGTEAIAVQQKNGVIIGVGTEKDAIQTSKVVIASGAWSRQLLLRTGLRIDVEPVRGQMILFRAQPGVVPNMVLYKDRYLVPRRDGRVLAGSTLEYVGFDKSTTSSAREDLHGAALAICPALAHYEIEQHWAGLRPGSSTGVPLIGEHPEINGLFVNTGHFRNGVVLGAASCRLMADLVLGREPILSPIPYRLPLSLAEA